MKHVNFLRKIHGEHLDMVQPVVRVLEPEADAYVENPWNSFSPSYAVEAILSDPFLSLRNTLHTPHAVYAVSREDFQSTALCRNDSELAKRFFWEEFYRLTERFAYCVVQHQLGIPYNFVLSVLTTRFIVNHAPAFWEYVHKASDHSVYTWMGLSE